MSLIVVNARFLSQSMTGVQRFAIEISKRLHMNRPSIEFIAPRRVIHGRLADDLSVRRIGRTSGYLWEQFELPFYLRRIGSPLLINLCNMAPVYYPNKITVIHDVAVVRFPQGFSRTFRLGYRFLLPRILRTSRRIITVSEFSRKEIGEIYGVPSGRIDIVSNAAATSSDIQVRDSTTQRYLLSVSSINPRKNLRALIVAFRKLRDADCLLYIVGDASKNFGNESLSELIAGDKRIRLLGRVSDDELLSLYRSAYACVVPSFYEGFGLPLIEAQSVGCPVVCSMSSSFPEVCGDSALYFDPYSADDITEKLAFLLSNPGERERLKIEGASNVARFSWEQSARRLSEIIDWVDR